MFVAFGASDSSEEHPHFLATQGSSYMPHTENVATGATLPLSYGNTNFNFEPAVQDMYRESVSTGLQGVPFNLVGNILLEEQLLGSPHGYGAPTHSPPLSVSDSDSQATASRRKVNPKKKSKASRKGAADESKTTEKKVDRAFSCPSCNKQFARKSNLVRHSHIHTSYKRFGCTYCAKGFTEKHHLKTHIRTHTGEYPFVCQHCGRPFRDRSNMLRHKGVCNGVAWAGYTERQDTKPRKRATVTAKQTQAEDEDPSFADFEKSHMDAALDTVAAAAAAAPRLPEPDEESEHSDSTTSADYLDA